METNQKGAIAKATKSNALAKSKETTLKSYIKSMEGEIAKALPSVMTPERFTRICLSAISNTPKLAECTPQSFLGAMMNSAQLGLEPNTPLGQAYLIPYENKKNGVTVCQFQIGYKGLIDLAFRSGEFKRIGAYTVYENDEFEYSLGLNATLHHTPCRANRGKPIYYYAVFELCNGGYGFECMSVEAVREHAQRYSKSYSSSPWQTNFDEMAKKTVIKKMLKFAPIKTDFAKNVIEDETVKTEISEDMSFVRDEFIDVEVTEHTDPITGEIK